VYKVVFNTLAKTKMKTKLVLIVVLCLLAVPCSSFYVDQRLENALLECDLISYDYVFELGKRPSVYLYQICEGESKYIQYDAINETRTRHKM
jgi:hypothetical protein